MSWNCIIKIPAWWHRQLGFLLSSLDVISFFQPLSWLLIKFELSSSAISSPNSLALLATSMLLFLLMLVIIYGNTQHLHDSIWIPANCLWLSNITQNFRLKLAKQRKKSRSKTCVFLFKTNQLIRLCSRTQNGRMLLLVDFCIFFFVNQKPPFLIFRTQFGWHKSTYM